MYVPFVVLRTRAITVYSFVTVDSIVLKNIESLERRRFLLSTTAYVFCIGLPALG
jgi:hypothetical protein